MSSLRRLQALVEAFTSEAALLAEQAAYYEDAGDSLRAADLAQQSDESAAHAAAMSQALELERQLDL